MVAALFLVGAGPVGRVRDVHHQRHLRVDADGAGARPTTGVGDFLARRRHGVNAGVLGPVFRQEPQRLGHDVGADAVVDAAGDEAAAREILARRVEHGGVAHPHALQRLLAVRGPDIDPQIDDLADLVEFVLLHQVRGLFPDDAVHRSLRSHDHHPLAHQHLRIPAADPGEVAEPFLVDVGQLQADLVDVAGEHQARRARRIHDAHRVAVRVGAQLVSEALYFFPPHPRRRDLEAGGTGGVEQSFQEVVRAGHGMLVGSKRMANGAGQRTRVRIESAAAPVTKVA